MLPTDTQRKNKIWKNYYYKRENLLNHLISCFEELENVYLKEMFKCYESFFKVLKV